MTLEALREQLELADRAAAEAGDMLTGGIPFRTPSRFGWPGRLLRSAVLRLIRPYVHFEARAHRHHLRSTQRIIESLRGGVPAGRAHQRAGNLQGSPDDRA
jgi:hypothetical protein